MNSLNPLFAINRAIYIITLLLYLAVSPGMLFQIILGIIQLISAIYLTINFFKKTSFYTRKLVLIYWFLTITTILSIFSIKDIFSTIGIIVTFVIPMLIATFFLFLLYKHKKEING